MVNIALFWTWYRIRPLYRPSGRSHNMHRLSRTWLVKVHYLSLLPIGSSRPLKVGTRRVLFRMTLCASNNAYCEVVKNSEHINNEV